MLLLFLMVGLLLLSVWPCKVKCKFVSYHHCRKLSLPEYLLNLCVRYIFFLSSEDALALGNSENILISLYRSFSPFSDSLLIWMCRLCTLLLSVGRFCFFSVISRISCVFSLVLTIRLSLCLWFLQSSSRECKCLVFARCLGWKLVFVNHHAKFWRMQMLPSLLLFGALDMFLTSSFPLMLFSLELLFHLIYSCLLSLFYAG